MEKKKLLMILLILGLIIGGYNYLSISDEDTKKKLEEAEEAVREAEEAAAVAERIANEAREQEIMIAAQEAKDNAAEYAKILAEHGEEVGVTYGQEAITLFKENLEYALDDMTEKMTKVDNIVEYAGRAVVSVEDFVEGVISRDRVTSELSQRLNGIRTEKQKAIQVQQMIQEKKEETTQALDELDEIQLIDTSDLTKVERAVELYEIGNIAKSEVDKIYGIATAANIEIEWYALERGVYSKCWEGTNMELYLEHNEDEFEKIGDSYDNIEDAKSLCTDIDCAFIQKINQIKPDDSVCRQHMNDPELTFPESENAYDKTASDASVDCSPHGESEKWWGWCRGSEIWNYDKDNYKIINPQTPSFTGLGDEYTHVADFATCKNVNVQWVDEPKTCKKFGGKYRNDPGGYEWFHPADNTANDFWQSDPGRMIHIKENIQNGDKKGWWMTMNQNRKNAGMKWIIENYCDGNPYEEKYEVFKWKKAGETNDRRGKVDTDKEKIMIGDLGEHDIYVGNWGNQPNGAGPKHKTREIFWHSYDKKNTVDECKGADYIKEKYFDGCITELYPDKTGGGFAGDTVENVRGNRSAERGNPRAWGYNSEADAMLGCLESEECELVQKRNEDQYFLYKVRPEYAYIQNAGWGTTGGNFLSFESSKSNQYIWEKDKNEENEKCRATEKDDEAD